MGSPVATFDVGGKLVRFMKDLTSSYKKSRFHRIISGEEAPPALEKGVYFFDRNPAYFE
jgi:hypothetical protein